MKYEYKITEIYDDQAPEDFGYQQFDKMLEVNDTIQLKWIDGRPAYMAKVTRIIDYLYIEVKRII